MSVADFGSGSGAYTLPIAQALANSGIVYAIDVQRDLLRRTRITKRKNAASERRGDLGELERQGASKIADRTLDLVLISNLLLQIKDTASVFSEAWRILKPAGRLVVIDWNEWYGGIGPQKEDVVAKMRRSRARKQLASSCRRNFPRARTTMGSVSGLYKTLERMKKL